MPSKVATTTNPPPPHTPGQQPPPPHHHTHPTKVETTNKTGKKKKKANTNHQAQPPLIQHRFSTDSNKQIATDSNRQTHPLIHHFIKQTPTATFTDLATDSNRQTPTPTITNPATKKPQTQKQWGSTLHLETQKFQMKPKIKPTTLQSLVWGESNTVKRKKNTNLFHHQSSHRETTNLETRRKHAPLRNP